MRIGYSYKDFVERVGLKNYFNYCRGVYNPTSVNLVIKPKPIQIKFSGWACTYVTKKIIHHTQRIPKGIEKEIGGDEEKIFCIVHIVVYGTDELKFLLGRFRNYAQRLS